MKRSPQPAPPRRLSVTEALQELSRIDRSLDAFVATAPQAVAELGGIDALRRASQATCVGPIPRLTTDQWALMAAEHAGRHSPYGPAATAKQDTMRDGVSSGTESPGRRHGGRLAGAWGARSLRELLR